MTKLTGEPWSDARSLDDLARATILFLTGGIDHTPMHGGPPDPETSGLISTLVKLNQCGFVTVGSQPGEMTTDVRQRAYVDGFCSEEIAARLVLGLLHSDLVVVSFAPGTKADATIAITTEDGSLFSSAGRHDPTYCPGYYLNEHSELADALARAWSLEIFDPVWGRNDLLWPALVEALS